MRTSRAHLDDRQSNDVFLKWVGELRLNLCECHRSDRSCKPAVSLATAAQFERKHEKQDSKNQGIGADPPSHDDCTNERRNNQQNPENNGCKSAQREPRAAVAVDKLECRRNHQYSLAKGPS